MSPTDPPLPPSPDEPSDDSIWASGEEPATGDEPATGEEPATAKEPATGDEPAGAAPGPPSEPPTPDEPAPDVEPEEPVEQPAAAGPPGDVAPTDVMPAAPTAVLSAPDSSPSAEMRRRVSHRRYVVRRIVVAVCALIVLGGIVGLIAWALDGDGDGGARGTGDSTQPAVVTDPATTRPSTTSPVATKPVAATEPADSGPVGSGPAESTMPDDTEPSNSPETTESPEDATATSAPATSEPEEPTYNLGLRAECQIDDVVQLGDTGPNVECLEQRLDQVTTGGVQFEVDDEFDDDTDAAIRQLQEANDLMVDGIVGPETGQLLSIWNPETE